MRSTQPLARFLYALPLIALASGCIVAVDDRRPIPPPPPVGGTELTYDTCVTTESCAVASDVCVTVTTTDTTGVVRSGNQCSSFCANESECAPINGFAGACYMLSDDPDFRNFTCYARCNTSAECDFGQKCVEVTGDAGPDAICLPAAGAPPPPPPPPPPVSQTYDPCIDTSDCLATDICVRVITTDSFGVLRDGQQCSNFCANDGECTAINGFGGACYMISSDPDFLNFTCFARCNSDAECDFTQDCVEVTGPAGPDAICLPAI